MGILPQPIAEHGVGEARAKSPGQACPRLAGDGDTGTRMDLAIDATSARNESASRPIDRRNPPPPIDVMGLPIRPIDMAQLIDTVARRVKSRRKTTLGYANAHTVNLARSDARYQRVLRDVDLLFADGISVVWASRGIGGGLPQRLTAADYLPGLIERCVADGISLYLLGGTDDVNRRAIERLRTAHPGLRIIGGRPGFFDPGQSSAIIADINAAAPDILLVGMSSPVQEFWIAEHDAALRPPVRWCVGALFDYIAGAEARAPRWMCRVGCEWLYRLLVDPVGKWRRYLLGNPRFVWNAVCWRLRGPVRAGTYAPARSWRGDRDGAPL